VPSVLSFNVRPHGQVTAQTGYSQTFLPEATRANGVDGQAWWALHQQ